MIGNNIRYLHYIIYKINLESYRHSKKITEMLFLTALTMP